MHLFVAQSSTRAPVLKGVVAMRGTLPAGGEGDVFAGYYDCAVKTLCAYANPAP